MNNLSTSYSKKLWKFIYHEWVKLYVQMIIMKSQAYKPINKINLYNKVKIEIELVLNVFGFINDQKLTKPITKFLHAIRDVWIAKDEAIVKELAVLRLQLRKSFNQNVLRAILRLRSDLSKEQKTAV